MRILGIDYGDSRVGIAITDELEITAQGLETIHYKGNDKILLNRIEEIIKKYEVKKVIVGMPINLKGKNSERVEITNKFINKIKCRFGQAITIETVDERLTTVEAHKTMNLLNIKKEKKKNLVDTISAVYILEKYINRTKK